MSFVIKWEKYGAVVEFKEVLSYDQVMQANDLLIGNRHFDSIFYQLWDFRGVTVVQIKVEEALPVAVLAKASSGWSRNQCIAIVVNLNPSNTAFFEIFKGIMQETQWECAIFQDKDHAIDWLNTQTGGKLNP